jgi:hypothetical protein
VRFWMCLGGFRLGLQLRTTFELLPLLRYQRLA